MNASAKREKQSNRSRVRPWLFLFAVAAAYGIAYTVEPDATFQALESFWTLLARVVPVLALVFVFLVLVDAFIDRRWVGQRLGAAAGIKGWALTVAAGVLSAGPIYAWYPLLAELKSKGMRQALIAAFLYARALKLPLLPMMVHYFGFAYTLTLSASILIASVLTGLLTGRLAASQPTTD